MGGIALKRREPDQCEALVFLHFKLSHKSAFLIGSYVCPKCGSAGYRRQLVQPHLGETWDRHCDVPEGSHRNCDRSKSSRLLILSA